LPKIDAGRSARQRVFGIDSAHPLITTGLWEIRQVLVFRQNKTIQGRHH
jgi:hypothetical protein